MARFVKNEPILCAHIRANETPWLVVHVVNEMPCKVIFCS